MFSKALLLLAVCFQVLRSGNSAIHREPIPGGWQKGKSVEVITKYKHEHTTCKIEFQDKRGDTGNCLLVSFDGAHRFVVNSYVNGNWQREDNYKIIDNDLPSQMLKITVAARDKDFRVLFEARYFYRKYEFPLERIEKLFVECPNEDEISVTTKWF